jgi:hypothetical protein
LLCNLRNTIFLNKNTKTSENYICFRRERERERNCSVKKRIYTYKSIADCILSICTIDIYLYNIKEYKKYKRLHILREEL